MAIGGTLENKVKKEGERVFQLTYQLGKVKTNLSPIQIDINTVMIDEVIDKIYKATIEHKE